MSHAAFENIADADASPSEPDLEWKIIYVGCAEDDQYDQVLDTVLVGPVAVGAYRFVFQVSAWGSPFCACGRSLAAADTSRPPIFSSLRQADPPDCSKIPERDLVGVTVVLLTCSYHDQARGGTHSLGKLPPALCRCPSPSNPPPAVLFPPTFMHATPESRNSIHHSRLRPFAVCGLPGVHPRGLLRQQRIQRRGAAGESARQADH